VDLTRDRTGDLFHAMEARLPAAPQAHTEGEDFLLISGLWAAEVKRERDGARLPATFRGRGKLICMEREPLCGFRCYRCRVSEH